MKVPAITNRVDVARAALLDCGRPDLAHLIRVNRVGDPSCDGGVFRADRPYGDSVMVLSAMRLGHLADPDGAPVGCDLDGGFPACPDGRCPICLGPIYLDGES